jgi:uncharacterized protein YrrD
LEETDRSNQVARETKTSVIAIGSTVRGRDSELGHVSKVIVDPTTETVIGVVVKHGLLGTKEKVVPLTCLQAGDGFVDADLDRPQFDELRDFDPAEFRAPDPDYTGPPGYDVASQGAWGSMAIDQWVAMGAAGGLGLSAKPLGYPGGETTSLAAREPAFSSLQEGADVLASNGEKVGELREFAVDESGAPARLHVRKGLLFAKEADLPVDWIADLTDGAVILRVGKQEVEEYLATRSG